MTLQIVTVPPPPVPKPQPTYDIQGLSATQIYWLRNLLEHTDEARGLSVRHPMAERLELIALLNAWYAS